MTVEPRFIQDSDDEDHLDNNPSPMAISNNSPICQHIIDPQSSPLSKPSSEEPCTGSTEILIQQIKDARDNLLKSSSDEPSSIVKSFLSSHEPLQSPVGPRVNLRRATTAFSDRKEKKPLKTYGSRTSQDDSRISSSSLQVPIHLSPPSPINMGSFNEDGNNGMTKEAVRDGLNGTPLMGDDVEHDVDSDPQNTLQGEYVHGASTTFASPTNMKKASMIADKSLELPDKSTMLSTSDEASALHGSCAKTTSFEPQYTSDDLVSLPTISKRSPVQVEEVLISDPIHIKSKKRPRFLLDLPDPCAMENRPTLDYHNVSPTKRARTGRSSKTDKQGEQSDQDDTSDELSLFVSKQQPSHATSKQPKTKRPRENDEPDGEELGSDDIGIGLPIEKYQPRPSRSRSGRQDGELIVPADFSKRPEAAVRAKKKNKRRKTTAFEHLVHENEDEMDVVQIKIPSPSKDVEQVREIPTKKNPEAANQTQPQVDPGGDTSTVAPPKKRGRPKKQVSGIHEEQEKPPSPTKPTTTTTTVLNKSTSKKNKAPLISDSDSDQPSATEHSPPPSPPPKDTKPQSRNPPSQPPQSPPIQNPPRVSTPRSPSPSPTNANTNNPSTTLQTPPPKPTAPAPATATAKGPDKHSPILSGKVAYRVGLSKRARIEPLLRVVRK